MENVILVNQLDEMIGLEEKMRAHELALLHRAFSVFVFNKKGELMLQRRALHKYHSPGLWTNTCCSHPRPGEETMNAARRRLLEEMGFDCDLKWKFSFIYQAPFDNGLTEHEFDHVFFGNYDNEPVINTEEVAAWKWINMDVLREDIVKNPDQYTIWFKIALERLSKNSI